jgi:hypothetical protein
MYVYMHMISDVSEESIVAATRNRLEMVRDALKGTPGHTLQDLGVIVVDDGPDPSLQLETHSKASVVRVAEVSIRKRGS